MFAGIEGIQVLFVHEVVEYMLVNQVVVVMRWPEIQLQRNRCQWKCEPKDGQKAPQRFSLGMMPCEKSIGQFWYYKIYILTQIMYKRSKCNIFGKNYGLIFGIVMKQKQIT